MHAERGFIEFNFVLRRCSKLLMYRNFSFNLNPSSAVSGDGIL